MTKPEVKTEPETIYLPFNETTERRASRTSESESEDITAIKYVLVRAFYDDEFTQVELEELYKGASMRERKDTPVKGYFRQDNKRIFK